MQTQTVEFSIDFDDTPAAPVMMTAEEGLGFEGIALGE